MTKLYNTIAFISYFGNEIAFIDHLIEKQKRARTSAGKDALSLLGLMILNYLYTSGNA
jgi:hypothetical protein